MLKRKLTQNLRRKQSLYFRIFAVYETGAGWVQGPGMPELP